MSKFKRKTAKRNDNKIPVVGIIQRGGELKAKAVVPKQQKEKADKTVQKRKAKSSK